MAAGQSSRFTPISYEKPKGVLKVRGEVLIERQIHQLLEAGKLLTSPLLWVIRRYFFISGGEVWRQLIVNLNYATEITTRFGM